MNVLRTTKRLTLNVFITDMLKELITSQFPILEISFVRLCPTPSLSIFTPLFVPMVSKFDNKYLYDVEQSTTLMASMDT